jgi:D-alanine-D-alanine ligase
MTTRQRPVVILHSAVERDAPADEQDTLTEVRAVAAALRTLGYRVRQLPMTLNLEATRWQLQQLRPQLVFNLVESLAGSGRYIHLAPALLEEQGLSYTGASHDAMFLTSNKRIAKQWLQANGIATPAWVTAGSAAPGTPAAGGPWLVKSVWEHASIGMDEHSLVHSPAALAAKLDEKRSQLGGDWFAESYIEGREFNISLLAAEHDFVVLPLAEIKFEDFPAGKPRIVGYAAKWESTSFEYQHTPRCFDFNAADRPLLDALRQLALRCARLFRLRGYARVDFRVDRHGRPWVLEINTNPCLAPDAGFLAAAARAQLDIGSVVERILADAVPAGLPQPRRHRGTLADPYSVDKDIALSA